MSQKKIVYDIGFNVDGSGLQKVRQELNDIGKMKFKDAKLINADLTLKEFRTIQDEAKKLESILKDSFNERLGTFNLSQINQELNKTENSLKGVYQKLSQLGTNGIGTFRTLSAEILTAKDAVKETSKWIESMAKTFGNTIKWSIASSTLNLITGTIQQAWGYTKKLDSSLNDIRIVTGKSADEMERFAKQANKAAGSLGASTTSYTNASLIYYQQGLGEKDVLARTETTIKAANVTGQSAAEVSEQLTAVWNGYKVVAEEAELYVDKLAAVAASTAADLEELSTGMSKVASAANAMGVNIDQLSAQLATIVSVTRQDASVVGTALKTIYSRMGDLKVDGMDEFGVTLGDVSSQLKQMGINVLDQQGNLRDMGIIIEEVAAKWGTWTDAQQQAAAVAIAGKRQYNNLIALFENWDMYESSLMTSKTSAGTLQEQQDIAMESLSAKLTKLSTAGEKVFDALLDEDSLKELVDFLTKVTNGIGDVIKGLGGIDNILLSLGAVLPHLFKSSIVSTFDKGINNILTSFRALNKEAIRTSITEKFQDVTKNDDALKKMVQAKQDQLKYSKLLTLEEKEQYDIYIKETAEAQKQLDLAKEEQQKNAEYVKKATGGEWHPNLNNNSEARSRELNIEATELEVLADTVGKKTYGKQFRALQDSDPELFKESAEYLKGVLGFTEETQTAITELIELKELEAKTFEKVGKTNTESLKRLEEAQKRFNNHEIDGETYSRELAAALKETAKQHRQVASAVEKGNEEIDEANKKIRDLDDGHEALQNTLKSRQKISAFTDIVSGVMAAISAYQSIINITKIWKDETADAGEKVLSTISSLAGTVISVTPTIVKCIETIAAGTNAAAGIIGLIAVAITVVAGIVASIIEAIPKQLTAAEKARKEAEAAQKIAQESAKAAKEVEQAYKDLNAELKNLAEVRTSIDSMKEGTEEWRAAVAELNAQIMSLINLYPQLATAVSFENGIATIDSEKANKVIENLLTRSFTQTAFAYLDQNYALKAKNNEIRNDNISTWAYTTTENIDGNFTSISKDGTARFHKYGYLSEGPLQDDELRAFQDLGIGKIIEDVYGNQKHVSKIDFSNFGELSNEQILAIKQKLEENDYGDELEEKISKTLSVLEENQKAIDQNSDLIQANTDALNATIANKYGYDTEVFDDITGGIKMGEVGKLDTDIIKNSGAWGGGSFFDVGENVDAFNQAKVAAREINKQLKTIFNGLDVVWEEVTISDVNGKVTQDLGTEVKIKVDGQEMTVNDAFKYAALVRYENAKKEAASDIETTKKLGVNQNAARYLSGRTGDNWTDATLKDYNEIINQADISGVDKSVVDSDRKAFMAAMAKTLKITDDNGNGFDDELARFSLFTEDDATKYNSGLTKLQSAGYDTSFVNNVQDPEKLKEFVNELKTINVNDRHEVANFILKYTGDIQEKIRKKDFDYFKNINRDLEKINSELERTVGLEKQSLLNKQAAAKEDYQAVAKSRLESDKNVFEKYAEAYGFGSYVKDGILNVASVYDKMATIEDKDSEEYKALETLILYWDDVISSEQQYQEAIQETIDAQIESFKYVYEFQKELNEIFRKWKDFSATFKSSLEDFDKSKAVAEKEAAERQILNANEDAMTAISLLNKYVNFANGTGENPFTTEGVFNSEAYFTENKDAILNAISSLEQYQGGIEALMQSYLSIQDEIIERYDSQIDKLSTMNSILKGTADLSKMIGIKDTKSLYASMTNNMKAQWEIAQNQLSVAQSEFAELTAANSTQEMRDKAAENLATAGENIIAKAQEYYQAIADQFSNNMALLIDDMVTINGASNLAGVTEAWDLAAAADQRYLDEVNEAYARDTLERRFKASLEETNNISVQNKLLEKQVQIQSKLEEIKRAQGKLAQADLDRANAEYELTLKQIALEEAQMASNKMKLIRDASGNYSYQYVADQNAILQAEEELAAAENNLYNMDKNRTQALVSEYYSTMSEANQQIAEAMAANDEERVTRLREYYFGNNGLLKGIQNELGFATQGLDKIGNVYSKFTDSIAEQNISDFVDSVNTILEGKGENGEGGLLTEMNALTITISGLLGANGALATLPEKLSENVADAVSINDLKVASQSIVTNLPNLLSTAQQLKALLDNGEDGGFINTFNSWIKNQDNGKDDDSPTKKISDNVSAIAQSLSNGLILKDTDGDGVYELATAANETGGQ